MLDATAPPFDPVDLEPALRPFGQSRMLPAGRLHLAAGVRLRAGTLLRRVLDLRGPRGRPGGDRRPAGGAGSARAGVLLARGDRRAGAGLRQHLPPPRPRAARGRRADHQADRALPLPRLDLRPGRVPAGRARVPRAHRVPTRPSTAWSSCRWRAGTGSCSSTAPATPRRSPSTSAPSTTWSPPTGRSGWSPGQPRLRPGLQLEGDARELPRVLPLPAHPPRAVPGQPAGQRRQLRARRRLGRRHHGPARTTRPPCRWTATATASPSRGWTPSGCAPSPTSGCSPTSCSACTPTT